MRRGERIFSYIGAILMAAGLSALPAHALDIGGNISGTISDAGEIRLTNNVTLTADTTLEADSNGSGDEIINVQGFAINGGGFNLTMHSGGDVVLGVATNIGTLALQSSDGGAVTYSSAVANAFSATTVRNDGTDDDIVVFDRTENVGGFFLLFDLSQLQDIDTGVLTTNYRLANNIDASATTQSTWNAGNGFNPIGLHTNGFQGTFDGNNQQIDRIYMAGVSNLGLFARLQDAYVENLSLTNVQIETISAPGRDFGAVAGRVDSTAPTDLILSNVTAHGTITCTNIPSRLGDLVGYSTYGAYRDCSAGVNITVTGAGGDVGGLVGNMFLGGLSNCFSTGSTDGDTAWRVGGLVGYLDGGGILDSYNQGQVQGATQVGGAAGFAARGAKLLRTYSSGTVTSSVSGVHSESALGGLVGLMWASGNTNDPQTSVEQSYSQGSVFAAGDNHRNVGGLVGGVWQGQVIDSLAVGDVVTGTNANNVGGLIGGISDFYCCGIGSYPSDIQRNYSTGRVDVGTAPVNVGGLIGSYTNFNGSTLTNNYWNTNLSGYASADAGVGDGDHSGGLVDGLSSTQMTNSSSYANWNFTAGTGVWEVELGHRPHLQWESFNFGGGGGGRSMEGSFGGGRSQSGSGDVVLALSVNGVVVATTVAVGNTFSFSDVNIDAGDAVLIFIQSGPAAAANLVGIVRDGAGDITGLRLYDDEITLGSENGQLGEEFSAGSGSDVFERAAVTDSNVLFTATPTSVVFNERLGVQDGVTYAPEQSVVLNDGLVVEGCLDADTNITIFGTFTLDVDAELVLDIGGYSPDAGYERLAVAGDVHLHGAIRVRLQNGFSPTNDATFGIVTANTIQNSLNGLHLPPPALLAGMGHRLGKLGHRDLQRRSQGR